MPVVDPGGVKSKLPNSEPWSLQPVARERVADGGRDPLRGGDGEQARDGIGGHAGRLQSARIGVEQRAQIVRAAAELVRQVVERLVEHDRAGEQSAEREVRVLLAERARGADRSTAARARRSSGCSCGG